MKQAVKAMIGAVALAGVTMIPSASAASASEQCAGTRIWHGVAKDQGHTVGELDVYWNASAGTNCARFNRMGGEFGDVGQRRETYVRISTCAGAACNSKIHEDVDGGKFAYYAGPVRVPGRDHCIQADGGVYLHGAWHQVGTGTIGCG